MELSRHTPSRIKLSFHIVGWLIFFFAPVILSPGRDIEAYFSEAPIITSLVVRNILLMILFYANLFYFTPKLFAPKSQATFFFVMGLLIVIVGSLNYYIHEILNGPFEGFSMRPPKGPADLPFLKSISLHINSFVYTFIPIAGTRLIDLQFSSSLYVFRV